MFWDVRRKKAVLFFRFFFFFFLQRNLRKKINITKRKKAENTRL